MVRHARYGGNTPITDTYVSYRQVQNCWLPDRWEATLRQGRKVINIVQARVESLELQPAVAEADFRIAELPGMLVSVGVIPKWEDESKSPPEAQGVRRFRIDETGHRQEVIFENGIEKHLRPRNWAWWLVGVLLLAVCGAVAIVWRRRLAAKR